MNLFKKSFEIPSYRVRKALKERESPKYAQDVRKIWAENLKLAMK